MNIPLSDSKQKTKLFMTISCSRLTFWSLIFDIIIYQAILINIIKFS